MYILIGSAWPYANGLHIGHIAALLPGDVLARYHRAKGDEVFYVSGTDCHGTPVAIRAREENTSPRELSDRYHAEFTEVFAKLGFSYDMYGKTSSDGHKRFVREFHRRMYGGGYIYEKTVPQFFCDSCGVFLADRYVVGKCPGCGEPARGDQCDACGTVLESEALAEPRCAVCGAEPALRESRHLYIAITKLEKELRTFVDAHANERPWRRNALAFSYRYLDEGLRDRAVTRDLDWGIDAPQPGFEDKKIYIWAENVLGYLSMSYEAAKRREASARQAAPAPPDGNNLFQKLWNPEADADVRHYYVHGKDNIPFHTIILPSLLLANGSGWRLPDEIISSEYLTLEGRKISTSRNWAVWAKDIAERYEPDSLRYFFIANGPERKDADFTWREYVNSHNGELLGAYGNFVNRSLAFIAKYLGNAVPEGAPDAELTPRLRGLYAEVGEKIESGCFKAALEELFEFIRGANKYFDSREPWKTRTSDGTDCNNTLYNCVQFIANLAVLLEPFLPFSSAKVRGWLGVPAGWKPVYAAPGYVLPRTEILFERLDKNAAEEELARMGVVQSE